MNGLRIALYLLVLIAMLWITEARAHGGLERHAAEAGDVRPPEPMAGLPRR